MLITQLSPTCIMFNLIQIIPDISDDVGNKLLSGFYFVKYLFRKSGAKRRIPLTIRVYDLYLLSSSLHFDEVCG